MIQNKELFGENIGNEKLNIILSLLSEIFFEYDIQKDLIRFHGNCSLDGIVKKGIHQLIINSELIFEEDKRILLRFIDSKLSGEVEFRQIDESGNYQWKCAKVKMVKDNLGNAAMLLGCIVDCTERNGTDAKMTFAIDRLTRLDDRDSIEIRINEYLKEEGAGGNHALFLVDLDTFKVVNQNLGRMFGDTVLANFAQSLKHVFYKEGFLGRIGGDEFIIFIKNINSIEKMKEKAAQISQICKDTYVGEMAPKKLTCSIGVSRYCACGSGFEELLRKADNALYDVKNKGKNDTVFFDDSCKEYEGKELEYNYFYEVPEDRNYIYRKYDGKLTTFAYEILANTKDINSGLNLLLDRVGKYFGVTHVSILETLEKDKRLNMTYIWSEQIGKVEDNVLAEMEHSVFEDYSASFDECGVLAISDCREAMEHSFIGSDLCGVVGAKSILQCAIYEEGQFCGCISIDDCDEYRNWSRDEIETLNSVANILSSYLLKIRTSQRINERIERLRNYDELTGIPTFYKFKKDAKELLSQKYKQRYAIVYSDISNFRYINDTLSYKAGDHVLCDYAEVVKNMLKKNEVAARITADNFMALLKYTEEESLMQRVESINEKFTRIQRKKNGNLNLVVISGVCVISEEIDFMTAIDNANIARKSIKTSSRTLCKIYDQKMADFISKEIEIANTMEDALQEKEFCIYLQPKINLSDGRLVGAEALVRWIKPDGTIITPDNFIPQFERNGFIEELDFYVFQETCKTLGRWLNKGIHRLPISVNVSRVHLGNVNFVRRFCQLVEKYHIPADLLELELTESIFLDQTERAINTMHDLRRLGFRVSIDDFGAGYSSLNLLKDMQMDVLKLDKEFFRQGEMQKEEKVIVTNIINMAKQLNMKVLSEGVETKNQSEFLKTVECDMAQGYFYSRPIPVKEFEALIEQQFFKL